jgi:hypothetical protein
MKWFSYVAISAAAGVALTLASYVALLWGMPYEASKFRHFVAYLGVLLLYPGALFGSGDRALVGNAVLFATAFFLIIAARHRKSQDALLAKS